METMRYSTSYYIFERLNLDEFKASNEPSTESWANSEALTDLTTSDIAPTKALGDQNED